MKKIIMKRRNFMRRTAVGVMIPGIFLKRPLTAAGRNKGLNIFFAIADDWSWPHAGAYYDKVIKTPVFDQIAKQGVLFENAYASAPSCSPSRAAILIGKYHWELEEGANLYGFLRDKFQVYTKILEHNGYEVGFERKGYGPIDKNKRKKPNPAGKRYKNFNKFLEKRDNSKPFCWWFGSVDPHRRYKLHSGEKSGIDPDKIKVSPFFPDSREIRGDVADYYFEVQRFDRQVGERLESIKKIGEMENTLVVVTSDNGMPFPRCKSNLYDPGVRVPLAIKGPMVKKKNRRIKDFVSTIDFAPTFLEAVGLKKPEEMIGKSLYPILCSEKDGQVDPSRDSILFGKERHVACQDKGEGGGYPCRAFRNEKFLIIQNFKPDRWPAGTPDYKNAYMEGSWYGDVDNGPTKTYMLENKEKDKAHKKYFDLAFSKRPEFELYDLLKDPGQQNNVADDPAYSSALNSLKKALHSGLKKTNDPRVIGGAEVFDRLPYSAGSPMHPSVPKKKKK